MFAVTRIGYSTKNVGVATLQVMRRPTQSSALRVSHRNLATSEKRTWKVHPRLSKKEERIFLEYEEANNAKQAKADNDGSAFLFLVVLPIVMTGLVLILREDLREELLEMAPIRLIRKPAENYQTAGNKDDPPVGYPHVPSTKD